MITNWFLYHHFVSANLLTTIGTAHAVQHSGNQRHCWKQDPPTRAPPTHPPTAASRKFPSCQPQPCWAT